MTKLKFFGSSTSLTNFQNVKNDQMETSNFEFYYVYPNITHGLRKLQVTKNRQSYHGSIFNTKSSQKVPEIAILGSKANQAFLDPSLTPIFIQMLR